MDKASAYGAEDCGFKSHRGCFFYSTPIILITCLGLNYQFTLDKQPYQQGLKRGRNVIVSYLLASEKAVSFEFRGTRAYFVFVKFVWLLIIKFEINKTWLNKLRLSNRITLPTRRSSTRVPWRC